MEAIQQLQFFVILLMLFQSIEINLKKLNFLCDSRLIIFILKMIHLVLLYGF